MAKHPRKRQRTDPTAAVQPLGAAVSLTDEGSKDDEERRLESLLFGVPFVPSASGDAEASDDDGEGQAAGAGAELNNLLDTDVRPTVRSPFMPTLTFYVAILRRRRRTLRACATYSRDRRGIQSRRTRR